MNEKTNVKDNFISIGKLSKITGVHVQSLRYYERIGILTPAYIDDSTKYRYYAFSQIKLVEAIQYCVELDIPLKEFSMFISKNQKQIDYEKLLQYGHEIAYRKIETIKQKMQFFEEINEDMKHGEMCMDSTPVIARFPSKTYLTIPYDGTQNSNVFHSKTKEATTLYGAVLLSLIFNISFNYRLRNSTDRCRKISIRP